MRSAEEFDTVQWLVAGVNDSVIARQTGIPGCIVRDWRRRPPVPAKLTCVSTCTPADASGLPAPAYAYLLGLYLGDRCVSRHPPTLAASGSPSTRNTRESSIGAESQLTVCFRRAVLRGAR